MIGMGSGLVCKECFAGGVTVCAAPVARRCGCGNHADVCAKCADARAARPDDMQKKIARKLNQLAKLAEKSGTGSGNQDGGEYHDGRAAAYFSAASIVEQFGRLLHS